MSNVAATPTAPARAGLTSITAIHKGDIIDCYKAEDVHAELQVYREALNWMQQYNGRSVSECVEMARRSA